MPRRDGQSSSVSSTERRHSCPFGVEVVSERLGHATISITLDTYSNAIPATQEEAAALIAGLVFAGE